MWYIYRNEYYSAIKKNEIMPFAAMNGCVHYHTKWSKVDRERQISHDITYMWNLKKMIQMNLFTKYKQTHRLRKQSYGYQRGKEGGGINWEFGINIYTLLYIK